MRQASRHMERPSDQCEQTNSGQVDGQTEERRTDQQAGRHVDGHTERQTDTPSLACRLSDRGWDCWGRQALFHSRPRSCHLVVHARFNIYARATSPSCAEVSALMLSHVLMFVLLFMRHLVRVCDRNAVSRVPFIYPILVYVA